MFSPLPLSNPKPFVILVKQITTSLCLRLGYVGFLHCVIAGDTDTSTLQLSGLGWVHVSSFKNNSTTHG